MISSKINETTLENSNQFLSCEKGNENTKVPISDDLMKVLDESSLVDLKFCISREMLNKKFKSVK